MPPNLENSAVTTGLFSYQSQRKAMTKNVQIVFAAAAAESLQSCPTLCDPTDSGPLGSPVPGILQARILEWVAISFSKAWKWKGKVKLLSRAWLLATPWTAAYQAPPSVGFSRQENWSGVPLPLGNEKYVGNKESWASFDFVEPTIKTTVCISKLSFIRGKIFYIKK